MKNKKIIEEVLEILISELDDDHTLEGNGWDSLAAINLMTLLSEKHDAVVDPDALDDLKTLDDLDKYIDSILN